MFLIIFVCIFLYVFRLQRKVSFINCLEDEKTVSTVDNRGSKKVRHDQLLTTKQNLENNCKSRSDKYKYKHNIHLQDECFLAYKHSFTAL